MCLGIVSCNLSVIRVMCHMGKKTIARSFSRSSSRGVASGMESTNMSTPEEIAFARLMGFLSITFVICWLPQLVS